MVLLIFNITGSSVNKIWNSVNKIWNSVDRIWNSVNRTSNPLEPMKYRNWKFCQQNFQLEALSTEFQILSNRKPCHDTYIQKYFTTQWQHNIKLLGFRILQHVGNNVKKISNDRSYLGFYVAFNTVQVISRRVVGRAEEMTELSFSIPM